MEFINDELIFESFFAFFAYATTRYYLPNTLLDKQMVLHEVFILSSCYALCAFLRKWGRENLINKKDS